MIGDALRLIRIFNDYTTTEMAQLLGMSQSYVSELENNKKTPSLEIINKYAEIFEMKPSTLLMFSEGLDDEISADLNKKQKVARAGMKLMKILEKVGNLYDE